MHEVARDTFDIERFHVITRLMWDSMENQRPAAWKVVFKGLTLLEHLIKNGQERCVDDARNHGHVLRTLGQFNYYEGTIDRGLGVREKSKIIVEILGDDERIREERQKAKKLREKFGGKQSQSSGGGGAATGGYGNQDSWNTGGGGGGGDGYGQGGIDANDNGGGYSGRYGGSSGDAAPSSAAPTPTFAAVPEAKPKKTKKKKKRPTAAAVDSAPAPGTLRLLLE
jgi:epsin